MINIGHHLTKLIKISTHFAHKLKYISYLFSFFFLTKGICLLNMLLLGNSLKRWMYLAMVFFSLRLFVVTRILICLWKQTKITFLNG